MVHYLLDTFRFNPLRFRPATLDVGRIRPLSELPDLRLEPDFPGPLEPAPFFEAAGVPGLYGSCVSGKGSGTCIYRMHGLTGGKKFDMRL